MEDVRESFDTPTNPVKVIRLKCLDCCNGSYTEVDACTVKLCPLFAWRFGKNPVRKKRVMTDEEKEALKIRMSKAREAAAVQKETQ